jgi:hypothetical protein
LTASKMREHIVAHTFVMAVIAYYMLMPTYIAFRAYQLAREAAGVNNRFEMFMVLVNKPIIFDRRLLSAQSADFLSRASKFEGMKMRLIVWGFVLIACAVGAIVAGV